jgi:hypothetical protein
MNRTDLPIASPCTADWTTMTLADRGRFCGQCRKVVRELAQMTEAEARAMLASPPTEGLCVRYVHDATGDRLPARCRAPGTARPGEACSRGSARRGKPTSGGRGMHGGCPFPADDDGRGCADPGSERGDDGVPASPGAPDDSGAFSFGVASGTMSGRERAT